MATQLHRRAATSSAPDNEGFVVISSERMAASRSFRAVEAPCIGVPPAMDTLADGVFDLELGPGVDVRETGLDLGFDFGGASKSETRLPAADGGGLERFGVEDLGVGAFDGGLLLTGVELPDLPIM